MVKLGARAAMVFDFVYVRADAASLDYSFQEQDEREHPTLGFHHSMPVCSALLLSSPSSPPCLPSLSSGSSSCQLCTIASPFR